jgi:hypothetical protein
MPHKVVSQEKVRPAASRRVRTHAQPATGREPRGQCRQQDRRGLVQDDGKVIGPGPGSWLGSSLGAIYGDIKAGLVYPPSAQAPLMLLQASPRHNHRGQLQPIREVSVTAVSIRIVKFFMVDSPVNVYGLEGHATLQHAP